MFNSKLKFKVSILAKGILKLINELRTQDEINHEQFHTNEAFEEGIADTQEVVIDLMKHLGLTYKIVDGKKVLVKKEVVKEKKKK